MRAVCGLAHAHRIDESIIHRLPVASVPNHPAPSNDRENCVEGKMGYIKDDELRDHFFMFVSMERGNILRRVGNIHRKLMMMMIFEVEIGDLLSI